MADTHSERVLTPPLLAFLLLVAGVLGWAVSARYATPGLDGCIERLADGDLDRAERESMLLRIVELAPDAAPRGQLAGWLAALALQDRARFDALGDGVVREAALPPDARRWLDLGDPLLANVLRARRLEAADIPAARAAWEQVAAQARMFGNRLAIDHATAELDRLQ